MKILNDNELNQIYSNNIDPKLIVQYYEFLMKYIDKKVGISSFDKRLEESPLGYIPVKEEDMDIYQYLFSDEYKYLYIRNDLHIENLSKEELDYLQLKTGQEYDDEIDSFIDKTYKRVITNKEYGLMQVPFGPINPNFMAPNGTLIIGLRYDEFNEKGMNPDEWDDNHDKQVIDLFRVMLDLEQHLDNAINSECKVIQYNEYSIKKKESESYIK